MVALQFTMAEAQLEHFSGDRLNPLAQCFGKLLEIIPITRLMGQERLNITQGLVDKVLDIQVKARVWAIEVFEGIVHLGYSPSVALCMLNSFMLVGNLQTRCFGEERQEPRSLRAGTAQKDRPSL